MVAAPPRAGSDAGTESDGDGDPPRAYDPLDMLVTSEPVAELDDALRCMARQLRQVRARAGGDASTRLQRWIDGRLDERTTFRTDPSVPPRARDRESPGCPPTSSPRGRHER